jgi:hypothetical protein
MCARCLKVGDKSKCPLPGCQYRRFDNDYALDLLTREATPDPLEEMAAGGKRMIATGNERGFTGIDEGRLSEYLDLQNTQAAFLQGTGRL